MGAVQRLLVSEFWRRWPPERSSPDRKGRGYRTTWKWRRREDEPDAVFEDTASAWYLHTTGVATVSTRQLNALVSEELDTRQDTAVHAAERNRVLAEAGWGGLTDRPIGQTPPRLRDRTEPPA
ncbi:MAG: hypothetical protein H6674_10975 [Dehalococcoidia bacterium]|nr:hypothetical protein [Dehalococcoidia bacterium]